MTAGGRAGRARPFPGVVWGDYPQAQPAAVPSGVMAAFRGLRAVVAPRRAPYETFAGSVLTRVAAAGPLDAAAIAGRLGGLRVLLAARSEWNEAALLDSFALACAAFESSLGIRPYASQVMAARVMLDDRLVEMATGEGKTVAIALAAAVAALGGTPVHVITANDYLAARDAKAMAPVFAALGLDAAAVTQPLASHQRRQAWACAIAYCTAKELVFDYLRDGMSRPRGLAELQQRAQRLAGPGAAGASALPAAQPLLRGLCMAIVDEADTVLIDEASVPLVLSQPGAGAGEQEFLAQAARCASGMKQGEHFDLAAGGGVRLADEGRVGLAAWPASPVAAQNDPRHREDAVRLALTAMHLLQRDRDYVVQDGQVTLIDATTGRTAPGRAWSRGLHQLVEMKEGCALTGRNSTVSQITYQRFFPRYLRLCGMSGTIRGSTGELDAVYGLATVAVPTRLPSRRQQEPLQLYPDSAGLWAAVAARVAQVHATGRPVLVGTGSVGESLQLSAVLSAAGLQHALLNARQDSEENAIVAAAGRRGRITVATSMAGRGTDIQLEDSVLALGGLHVILCQHNASRRIDRQFIGRAGRRGEPGSVQVMLALDFPLFVRWLPQWWRAAAGKGLAKPLLQLTALVPQVLATYTQRQQRHALCRADEDTERALTFNRETFS